jgi:predicted metal-dependent enzyme (double-stranded beta helix superfamily)
MPYSATSHGGLPMIGAAPSGTLSRTQLRVLVDGLASADHLWRHLARHEPDRRVYEELLLEDPQFAQCVGVWLICWMDNHDTGFHDHDVSSGAVAVVAGTLRDERLVVGANPRARNYSPGETFDFGPSDIHRMSHAGGGPAISIHAYSPPLERMGAYEVDPEGVLRRAPISYTEELRPAMHAAA